jgi:mannose-6-phosphate isomerase-like protein (cupin superfamily)
MLHIPKSKARRIPIAPEFTIYEYGPLGASVANGTVAEINGRYPLLGWGRNLESDEIVYVISGSGELQMPDSTQRLESGDVAFVPKGQKIAWHGNNLVVFIPCVPAWRPEQHEILPE